MFYDFVWETKGYFERWPCQYTFKMMDTLEQKSTAGAVFSNRFMYRTSVLESTGRLSQCPKRFKSHCLFVRATLPRCMEIDGTGTGEGAEDISCIPRSVACSLSFPSHLGKGKDESALLSACSLALSPLYLWLALSLPFSSSVKNGILRNQPWLIVIPPLTVFF